MHPLGRTDRMLLSRVCGGSWSTHERRTTGDRAVIIKHKLCLSDVETVQQIQENPYLQFFVGLPGYQTAEPFASSLFVEIRKRMGEAVFEGFHRAIIEAHEGKKPAKPEPPTATESQEGVEPDVESSMDLSMTSPDETQPLVAPESTTTTHPGQLILDATVVEQAIRFPTDLSLLNEAREFSEQIIDTLCKQLKVDPKPRTLSAESPLGLSGRCQAKASWRESPAPWPETAIAVFAPQPRAHRTAPGADSGGHTPAIAALAALSLLGDSTPVSATMGHVPNQNPPLRPSHRQHQSALRATDCTWQARQTGRVRRQAQRQLDR